MPLGIKRFITPGIFLQSVSRYLGSSADNKLKLSVFTVAHNSFLLVIISLEPHFPLYSLPIMKLFPKVQRF